MYYNLNLHVEISQLNGSVEFYYTNDYRAENVTRYVCNLAYHQNNVHAKINGYVVLTILFIQSSPISIYLCCYVVFCEGR